MRDLTTIALDEIRRGGTVRAPDFETAESYKKAVNRKQTDHNRAICKRDLSGNYPGHWLVSYGDHRNRSDLLSIAQMIRRDHIADAQGLGLDVLVGLLYSLTIPWDSEGYSTRMSMWVERLIDLHPEIRRSPDSYSKAWKVVEPLIAASAGFKYLSKTVIVPNTEPVSRFAPQNEGIRSLIPDDAQESSTEAHRHALEAPVIGHTESGRWIGALEPCDLHKLYPLVKPWARLLLNGHTVEVVCFPFFEDETNAYGFDYGTHLVLVRLTPNDPSTMVAVSPEELLPTDLVEEKVDGDPQWIGHTESESTLRVIDAAMDAADENHMILVAKLAGSLLPFAPDQGPVEGTRDNMKLHDFIGQYADNLMPAAREKFLTYVNAAAVAAQIERDEAINAEDPDESYDDTVNYEGAGEIPGTFGQPERPEDNLEEGS
jgi:hypothetical protein